MVVRWIARKEDVWVDGEIERRMEGRRERWVGEW